jgi:L-threonylcarbamoyladenylate synthase
MIFQNKPIKLALKLINKGEIIILPTDTLYGFSFDATNNETIKKFNTIKNRNSPLSIIVDSIQMAKKYADNTEVDKVKHLLPGPFTFLFSSIKNNLPDLLTNQSEKIGIRIPNNVFCIEIVRNFKRPLVTTSVNFHSMPALQHIKEIEDQFPNFHIFKDHINLKSKGSTIVDLTFNNPKILRQGDGIFN